MLLITSNKGGGKCVCPRLSVSKITQKREHGLDEMLLVDRCRDMDELINGFYSASPDRYVPVPYENGLTYRHHSFFTIR